jgi:hypothetical protein
MEDTSKSCSICKAIKPLTDYHRNKKRPGGRVGVCITCTNTRRMVGLAMVQADALKTCIRCGITKTADQFGPNMYIKTGLRGDCKACDKIDRHERYHAPGSERRQRDKHYKNRYGITVAEYEGIFERQGGVCAICGDPPTSDYNVLCVDHCHATGQVRKLLCRMCNVGLGKFRDNATFLRAAAEYLERFEASLNNLIGGHRIVEPISECSI